MARTPCKAEGCDKQIVSHGYCSTHWSRIRRTGSLQTTVRRGHENLEARYWDKVDKRGPDECWPWKAQISGGHGRFKFPGGQLAHRFGYELAHGPIPDGLEIDHMCHRPDECEGGTTCPHRSCQNPAHMEAVPKARNSAATRKVTRGGWSDDPKAAQLLAAKARKRNRLDALIAEMEAKIAAYKAERDAL